MFWKDDKGNRIGTLGNLKKHIETQNGKVQCLMNAGMFKKDFSPQGLFIENGKMLTVADNSEGVGNYYLHPNGRFYVTDNDYAFVCPTGNCVKRTDIAFATQSGPMLVIDGKLHPAFKEGSTNLNIRNGVGILPNGNVLLAISDKEINLYDFAMFFKNAGCKNALYLDGFVSRAYIPSKKRYDHDGNFGPMIAVVEK